MIETHLKPIVRNCDVTNDIDNLIILLRFLNQIFVGQVNVVNLCFGNFCSVAKALVPQ